MSSVIRPSGPLPPRVYWVRRLLLLALALVLVSALWWLLSGLGGAKQAGQAASVRSTAGSNQPSSQSSNQSATPGSHHGKHHKHRHQHRRGQHGTSRGPHHRGGNQPRLAVSTGPCAASDVGIGVDMADAVRGAPATAKLSLTSVSTPACTLDITPKSMVLRIIWVRKTGLSDELIWTSDQCPDAVPVRQAVVRADPATTYRFRWDGQRSAQGCSSPVGKPKAGHYLLQVALVGGNVSSATFHISP